MITTTAHGSIDAFAPVDWNHLFPHELEDHAYLRAVERAGLAGFRYLYFAVCEGEKLLAAVPAFVTDYRLDTTVRSGLRRLTGSLAKLFPRLLRVPMLSLGSPVTERCRARFAPDSTPQQRAAWLDAILTQMETVAAEQKLGMLAIKDAPCDEPVWQQIGSRHGLHALPGLPGATLDLRWHDIDAYLDSLGASTRKDLRRKRREGAALRIEWRGDVIGIADDVQRLYRETLAHAELAFEELTPAYFDNVLRDMPGRAFCVTYSENDRLVAFNLVLRDSERLLDKFLGMDYAAMDRYNLYHVSWLENVRYCIGEGIGMYESGQGLYREKVRLGSTLHANALWYHHRNRLVDGVFARLEKLASLDRFEEAPATPGPSRRATKGTPGMRTQTPTRWRPPIPLIGAWAALLIIETLGQVAMKMAGANVGAFEPNWPSVHAALSTPWLWLALACYLGQFAVWMTILEKSTLSAAFSTSAIVFVAIMFASWAVFGDPMGWEKILGSIIIVTGILLLGGDAQHTPPVSPRNDAERSLP
jgi:predicted N-acyltransferase/multidrug transporter EmrE-like cation transporter